MSNKIFKLYKYVLSNKKQIKSAFQSAPNHVLAMFPATVLMPLLVNKQFDENIFDISTVLFFVGIGTIFFVLASGLPAVLSSSFAFIGMSVYILNTVSNSHQQIITPQELFSYLTGAYLMSGVILLIIFVLFKRYKEACHNAIDKFLPPAVMGPAISLIGLGLIGQTASQAGLTNIQNDTSSMVIFLVTFFFIVVFAVSRYTLIRNTFVLSGVAIGLIVSHHYGLINWSAVNAGPTIAAPNFWPISSTSFHMPSFDLWLLWVIVPATLVLFCEHFIRVKDIEDLRDELGESSNKNNSAFPRSLLANAIPIMASGFVGSVPTTIYAENIALSRIKKQLNWQKCSIVIAAVICIILSTFRRGQSFLDNLPDPVMGGLSLVLLGIIAAPGIKYIVDRKVNYKRTTNLLLTSTVLVAGISGITIPIVEISGMGLGIIAGIILNLIFIFMNSIGLINENLSKDEIVELCRELCPGADEPIWEKSGKVVFAVNGQSFLTLMKNNDNLLMKVICCPNNEILYQRNRSTVDSCGQIHSISDVEDMPIKDLKKIIKNAYNHKLEL